MTRLNPQRICLILSCISSLTLCLPAVGQKRQSIEQLRQNIEQEISKQPGVYAVAFKDGATGRELLINEHQSFHAASTMKTPVMIEVYKQQTQGKLSLSDSIPVKTEFISIVDGSPYQLSINQDSDTSTYKELGRQRTMASLLYDMITVSSNLATNLIIERVGAPNVLQTMRDMGAKDIQVLRGVEDTKAFQKGLNNTTTAYDLMLIFSQLAQGQAVSPEASAEMVKVLLDQKFKSVIPAKLPSGVKVAHKTGSIAGVHHDSGIVYLPDGRYYVLVLLSQGIKDDKAAVAMMAGLSERIYQYVTQP
ncbi:serine hydrolase [Spirosoma sp. KUDC1026]|uniref:serine hydrolase n=1 Tax=Spirosoma sp. KUDC1026 TaxID=2745947 RepID=UPI00159BC4F2|nr:serine hydrolase [Spirosoma sp. KUDC1026]QKZ14031.1 serine hydrolase [Spirosoma sp. KUDC1026]